MCSIELTCGEYCRDAGKLSSPRSAGEFEWQRTLRLCAHIPSQCPLAVVPRPWNRQPADIATVRVCSDTRRRPPEINMKEWRERNVDKGLRSSLDAAGVHSLGLFIMERKLLDNFRFQMNFHHDCTEIHLILID